MDEEDKLQSNLKLLAKTSFIVFIGMALSKVLGYVFRVIVARYYGPEVYGLFSIITMVLGIIIAISSLGFMEGLLRFIPQYRIKEKAKANYLFRLTTKILIFTSLVSAILLFLLSKNIAINIFHNEELIILLRILSFFVPIAILSGPMLNVIRAYEMINSYSFIYNILQNIIRVLSLIILVVLGLNSSATVISFGLGFATALFAAYIVCKYKIPELLLKESLSEKEKLETRKEFFSYSLPLLFFGLISMLFYWTDSFFLGYYKGVEAVGFYNAAVPIATLLAIIPELFMQLFFPMINREYSKKHFDLINQLSKQIGKWIFMVNFPIFVLIFVFPGAAINILFGSQYLIAENTLRILMFGSFIASIAIISNNLLSMIGKSKMVLTDIVITSVINLILNVILIPMPTIFGMDNNRGIIGAAFATTLSIMILNILFVIQAKRKLNVLPIRMKMLNISLIGIISALILIYFRSLFVSSNVFLIGFLAIGFLIIYSTLLFVSKSFDKNDWTIILAIKRKILGTK